MHCVYVLISNKDKRSYVGVTNDIDRRLKDHTSGKVKSTKHRRPLKLFHLEKFESSIDAKKRESWLKTSAGRNHLKKLFTTKC